MRQLSSRKSATERRIPIGHLERFGRLENDLVKVGDEIRSLARFTTTQRTAFKKLLKKYKKWADSACLERRLREEILENPKSFTNIDLAPLLHEYSQTLQSVRTLYEVHVQGAASRKDADCSSPAEPFSMDRLRAVRDSQSKVAFDTALATVPIGEPGTIASFFVHPECVVELQVLLLQHMQFHTSNNPSASKGLARSSSRTGTSTPNSRLDEDSFALVADDLERLAHVEGAVTVDEREHVAGSLPQNAMYCLRWTRYEDVTLAARVCTDKIQTAPIQGKYPDKLFDRETTKSSPICAGSDSVLAHVQEAVRKSGNVRPLYKISTCRSRFAGINDGPKGIVLAALDSSISIGSVRRDESTSAEFPFAVLYVRSEGTPANELVSNLEKSHLVERVRGFSLHYHALWEVCRPTDMSPPFWTSILSHDIRKLPPPARMRSVATNRGTSSSRSATNPSTRANSSIGVTDETTAVEVNPSSDDTVPARLSVAPLASFGKKKRRRAYAETAALSRPQRYWSEYDDERREQDAFVIYLDPEERSALDTLIDRIASFFARKSPSPKDDPAAIGTPQEDESSSDDEAAPLNHKRNRLSYGTLTAPIRTAIGTASSAAVPFLPPVTVLCLCSSAAILVVAGFLAATSKHKYATQAGAGTVFAVLCSVAFALVAVVSLLRWRRRTRVSEAVVFTGVVVDALCSAALLVKVLA